MNCFDKQQIKLITILGTMLLACIISYESVYGSTINREKSWQRNLEADGYQTDTAENIISATKSNSYFTRYIAMDLLTKRYPQEAVPVLKQSLNDKEIVVRCTAAHLLGTLGDKSGLEQMQKDFEEFIPKENEPNDPNILWAPGTPEKYKWSKRYRVLKALEIGKVLAELGDFRAYNLAVKEGLTDTNKSGTIPIRAAEVLGEIGKKDANELKTRGMDPVAVLCKMAETEKKWIFFNHIKKTANEIGGNAAVQINEKADTNPNRAKMKEDFENKIKMIIAESKKKSEPNNPQGTSPPK